MKALSATRRTISAIQKADRLRIDCPGGKMAKGRHAITGGSGESPVPCIITSGTTAAGYAIDIYADGYDSGKTGTGTLAALMLSIGSDLPAGYKLWVLPMMVAETGEV